MKVKFMNLIVTVTNETPNEPENFVCHWNDYSISVTKWGKNNYVASLDDPHGKDVAFIENCKTRTEAVQAAFDEIAKDIESLEVELTNILKRLDPFNYYRSVHKCPFCNSKRLFRFRLDSDWASGSGDYYPLPSNDTSLYTEEELKYDSFDRPDIDLYHCLDCNRMFD